MKSLLILFGICVTIFSFAENDSTIARIEKIKDIKSKASHFNEATELSWRSGNYNNAIIYAELGLVICENDNFPNLKSSLLNNQGRAYYYLGDYSKSLTNYFKALHIQDKMTESVLKANILNNIGLVYSNQLEGTKALEYHQKSLKIRKRINDSTGISASYNNIAIVNEFQKNYPEAIKNYSESIKIDKAIGDKSGLADDYNNIGLCYMNMKDYDVAMNYYEKSLHIRDSLNNQVAIFDSYLNIASLYYKKAQYPKSREIFLSLIPLAKDQGRKESLRYIYENLANIEQFLKNPNDALYFYKLFIFYRDSLENTENTRIQTEMEMQYKFDNEKEATRLIQEKKEAQAKTILYSVIGGLVLILVFSILLFKRWKQTQGQQRIIEEKNALVEQKNEEIMDSIAYAKRIQTAILPSSQVINELIPNQFVLYIPKDIVAGDFYWLEEINEIIFFAIADCTGHGVPGAMMSVVCHNALNRSVREFGLKIPGEILDKTREIIVSELSKNDQSVADGMDISLCVLGKDKNKITWAGANNPLWILRSETKEFDEYKPNKQPIGLYQDYHPFTTHQISINKNDRIYLFTDGFADQFGGPNGKKLMRKAFQNYLRETSYLTVENQKIALENFYLQWKGNLDQVDDVCVSCIVV